MAEEPRGVTHIESGYRLPAGLRLGCVRLQVADLQRSVEWYGQVLGLTLLATEGNCASLGTAEGGSTLVELYGLPGASAVPRHGRLGLYHFALLLPDRRALGRFAAHCAHLDVPLGAADHLVSEALYLHDPDGLGIEVYADRPRDSWRREGGQLVMATEPLDLADLSAAAGDQPWAGMPAGGIVGHMHLHVADLERADAFYHAALGFDRTVWSYPGALFLSAGGYHHHLGLNTWARNAQRPAPDDSQLLEWEIVLPSAEDVEAALASTAAAGRVVEYVESGGRVRDDWGTALRLRAETSG